MYFSLARGLEYILGARLRRQREVRIEVLGRAGRYQELSENLKVKEVWVEDRRYIVCYNPQETAKEAADRQAILKALEDKRFDQYQKMRCQRIIPPI